MSKQRKKSLIVIAVIVLIGVAFFSYVQAKSAQTYYLSVQDKNLGDNKKDAFPQEYKNEADNQGTLECVKYSVTAKGKEIEKRAMVYLPYGYDASSKYDVVYLMHGRGGKYTTWLGTTKKPREFKNVLDNMIQNKEIKPIIVVTPGLTYEYGDQNTKKRDEASDNAVVSGTADEICNTLIPLIDSKYSTYGKRENRCMAGFSMGGSLTWHTLMDHTSKFYYYIPMSMAIYFDDEGYSEVKSLNSVRKIDEKLKQSGYGVNDYKVYVATGDDDHKSVASYMMVKDLIEHTSQFVYADPDFKTGNIYLNVWSGRWHNYKQSFPYIYNGLKRFFKY